MINLLPPTLKEELQYAKYNRVAVRYLQLLVVVAMVLGAVFGASLYFLTQQANKLAADVNSKQQTIASYAPAVAKAKAAADRLNAIKAIQASQTRFSTLLSDLAKVLPNGVAIDSITLTGDDTKPVRISVTGSTYDMMLAFRDALAQSPRISGVDLENITQSGPGIFTASVVIGFKPGEAK